MLAHPVISWLINTDLFAANGGYGSKMSPHKHGVAFGESERDIIDSANTGGALDNGIEHRLHVRGRAADDAEDFGSRSLMLQRFAQFRVGGLQLFTCSNKWIFSTA